jgi:hypothetical protein
MQDAVAQPYNLTPELLLGAPRGYGSSFTQSQMGSYRCEWSFDIEII